MNKTLVITMLAWISGCSLAPYEVEPGGTQVTVPESSTSEEASTKTAEDVQVSTLEEETVGPGTVLQSPSNPAVTALQKQAQSEVIEGRYDNAVMSLERAVRITPRDPKIWLELAKIRLTQGQYDQARELAQKARRLAGVDGGIKAEAENVINRAR